MLTAAYFISILWAKNSPNPPLERAYFQQFLYVTVILETMRRVPTTNQWSIAYFYTYWVLIAFISGAWPIRLFYARRWKMLRPPNLALTATWFYMLIYYVGYFSNWHSARLDWVPTTLYTIGFAAYGLWARPTAASRRKSTTGRGQNILPLRPLRQR